MTDLTQSAILRLEALNQARTLPDSGTVEQILVNASKVLAFLESGSEPPAAAFTASPTADPAPQTATRRRGRPPKVSAEDLAEATDAEVVEPETTETEPAAEAVEPEEVQQLPKTNSKPPKAAPGVNRDTLAKAMEEAVKGGQRDGLKAILGKYGATNLTGIKEAQYGEFLGLIDQMMLNA